MNPGTPITAAEARGDEPYSEPTLTDHALAEEIVAAQERIADNESVLHALRIEVQRRITDAGATMLADPDFTIELQPSSPTYDHGLLIALREWLTESEYDEAFTPAHEKQVPVPQRWDGGKLRKFERTYGGAVASIIERARIPGVPRVVVERKKES